MDCIVLLFIAKYSKNVCKLLHLDPLLFTFLFCQKHKKLCLKAVFI